MLNAKLRKEVYCDIKNPGLILIVIFFINYLKLIKLLIGIIIVDKSFFRTGRHA